MTPPPLDFVGDIGGTNARFARLDADGRPGPASVLRCADYPGPLEALRDWLAGAPARHAAIGIATALDGDRVQMTNHAWRFSIRALQTALDLETLHFLNDFTALALALPHMGDADRQRIGSGEAVAGAALAVIGPGTGLGVSGLLQGPGGAVPIAGEGGHVTLAGQSDEERALIALLCRQHSHVSAERLLCGPGIVLLHRSLGLLRGVAVEPLSAPQISEAATLASDALCVDTLNTFCALLGTQAANLALTLGARGGVYIGGGIVPQLGSFFARSPFRQRFEDKGRFSTYLARIPTWVITHPCPALLGAAAWLKR